jgi:hypothetical protein
MTRLRNQQIAAMDRNREALMQACIAHEPLQGDNALRARRILANEDSEAQFDIEGSICWRDPHAARCAA